MEELSQGYLFAVCACGNISAEIMKHDEDSKDMILRKTVCVPDKKINLEIGVQLKSTKNYKETENEIKYDLNVKNFNDMRMRSTTKTFLFVLIMPENCSDWVCQCSE